MSRTDENKPNARAGQRRAKSKEPGPKVDQRQRAKPDGQQDNSNQLETAVALNETLTVETGTLPDPAVAEPAMASEPRAVGALVPVASAPIAMTGPVETFWTGFHTIAHVHRDYAWRSLEETLSVVEKLALARSLDKTVEIQNAFTRQACDDLLENSQNIWHLYREFGRQMFRSLERLLARRRPVAH